MHHTHTGWFYISTSLVQQLSYNSYLTTVNGLYLQLTYNNYQTTARESSTGQGVLQGYMYSTRNVGVSGQLNVQ